MRSMRVMAALVAAGLPLEVSQADFIDDFTSVNPPPSLAVGSGAWLSTLPAGGVFELTETNLPDVPGGTRTVRIEGFNVGGPSDNFAIVSGGWSGEAGVAALSLGAGNRWARLRLRYDGGGRGLGLDLSAAGAAIGIDWDPDHVGFGKASILSVTLSDGTHAATVSRTWSSYATPDRSTETFNADAFARVEPALDLSRVRSVEVGYESDYANDVALFSVVAFIPEPSSLVLMLAAGVAVLRRRG